MVEESTPPAQTGSTAESDPAPTGSPAASAATSGEQTRALASTTAEATNSANIPSTSQPDTTVSTTADRPVEEESEYDIYDVIPRDRIPAILDPQFLDVEEAIEAYNEHEQVLGLSINGDHRAYPIPYLSQHEIVNDVVGGEPVAVTW